MFQVSVSRRNDAHIHATSLLFTNTFEFPILQDSEKLALHVQRDFTDLGFTIDKDGESLPAGVPSWRSDSVGEACLIEDVVRIYANDRIPA